MQIQEIPIKDIIVIENHRLNIHETQLNELMQSIKEHGLEQPIGLSPDKNKKYALIFGHRRMLACQKLGWEKIPAIVQNVEDVKKLLLLNITENLQRKDPSFIEFGRAIEKLSRMDMNAAEIGARLGIPEDKVKMIMATYTKLPAKHRDKVEFLGKGSGGGRGKGKIPAQTAMQVLRMKKSYGLKDKNVDDLLNMIKKDELGKEDLKNLVILLKTGIKFEDAYEKLFDYFVYRIDLVANRSEIGKLVSDNQLGSHQILFKRILYGQMKGVKKPDFIRV